MNNIFDKAQKEIDKLGAIVSIIDENQEKNIEIILKAKQILENIVNLQDKYMIKKRYVVISETIDFYIDDTVEKVELCECETLKEAHKQIEILDKYYTSMKKLLKKTHQLYIQKQTLNILGMWVDVDMLEQEDLT